MGVKMSIQTIKCKYCNCEVSYAAYANFIVFCPKCKREIHFECEYGYGPVTPCVILLGEDYFGKVTKNNKNEYLLEIMLRRKKIKLMRSYLEALYEAREIVGNMLAKQDY